jgi:hypothetical protein
LEKDVGFPQRRPWDDEKEDGEFEEEQDGGECEYAVHPSVQKAWERGTKPGSCRA